MKNLILAGMLMLPAFSIQAADTASILVSDQQKQMLGIQSEPLKKIGVAWGTKHPATVQVPNEQLRVVSTAVSGLVERLEVAEGAEVKKGDVLAVIMSPKLLEMQRDYLYALTALDLASTAVKRDENLDKEGVISKRGYHETRSEHIRAKTSADQMRQLLEHSGMDAGDLDNLIKKEQLSSDLKIRSPLDGIILEQMAVPGQRLEALDPIYRVGHLSPLWLEIHAPIDDVASIRQGTKIRVEKFDIGGKVITIGRMVHGEDQGVMIRAEVTENAELLRPGQFVQVSLAVTAEGESFRVPRSALIRQHGASWVFLKNADGFIATQVSVITEESSHLIISGPFKGGEEIAVSGTSALKAIWLEAGE
jgi:RND family efflux transporter MFP subunit